MGCLQGGLDRYSVSQPPGLRLGSVRTLIQSVSILCILPSKLAFWALFHCRHARPPDTRISR